MLPNTPGQVVEINVTGGDAVKGVDFNAQVADGGVGVGGTATGPKITSADIVTGTIFAANNTGDSNANPNYVFGNMVAFHSTTTVSGTVPANGRLATMVFDTTGFTSGTWTLRLAGTVNGDTAFGAIPTNIINGNISIGATAPPSAVVDRHLFYNQSGTATRYDGNNLAINASDDAAIATDKTAYFWEDAGAATFANISSYSKGINGIMIDLAGPHGSITAADFIFRVGNNNSPGLWATANAPSSISVRAGAGTSGSDRIEIIWNGAAAPIKQWLQVITLANANTGLPQKGGYPVGQADAFFFGNAVGNSGLGDTAINATVNATDEIGARNNPANLAANIPITNIYDYDRNAQVNAADQIVARNNATNPTTVVKYLNLTTAPAAPEADVFAGDEHIVFAGDEDIASDSGVASALAAPAVSSLEGGIPKWLTNRIDSIDLNTGSPARLFQYLHDQNSPRSRALLQKIDAVADSLGVDDMLLDDLLADLTT